MTFGEKRGKITLRGIGKTVLVQPASDVLWVLASRLYHEVFHANARIRQFVDLLALVRSHYDEIDWDRILRIAEKYELRPSLYYVFAHLNEFLEKRGIPDEVLGRCYPIRSEVNREHDWGDLMPRLFRKVVVTPLAPQA